MNRDKQIEEMHVDLMQSLVFSDKGVKCGDSAINLYAKGYRKASEVAREFADEIGSLIDGSKYSLLEMVWHVKRKLDKLEKKYTEEGEK